jgi:hypothetical protein
MLAPKFWFPGPQKLSSSLHTDWSCLIHQPMSRRDALVLTGAAAGAALLAACGDKSPTAPPLRLEVPDPTIAVRSDLIAPKDTDPAIDTALEPHYVVSPVAPLRGRLFVFLPATGGLPTNFHLLADQGARNGFHVVALRYPNTDRIQDLCGTDPDTTCFEKTRLETIDGTDRSTKVNVNRANSIENRLVKLLGHLQTKYPTEGWGAYVDAGAPKWESIVVAGLSQGGGHAALIARDHVVARVVMFSSPVDRLGANTRPVDSFQPAPWLLGMHATPSERYYAFGHVQDETNNWDLQWKALALGLTTFGAIVNVDNQTSPFAGSHLLTSAAQPRSAPSNSPNHLSTAADNLTALTPAGQPVFAPAWQYLAFA